MEIAAQQKQQLKILFKFAQGAGHVWDNHELGLIKEERTLQVKFCCIQTTLLIYFYYLFL